MKTIILLSAIILAESINPAQVEKNSTYFFIMLIMAMISDAFVYCLKYYKENE